MNERAITTGLFGVLSVVTSVGLLFGLGALGAGLVLLAIGTGLLSAAVWTI